MEVYQPPELGKPEDTTDSGVGTVVGRAGSEPVAVYLGRLLALGILVMLLGGHWPYWEV